MKITKQKTSTKPNNKISFLNYERDVLLYMFRYCVTRQSYAVGTCVEILKSNWHLLSEHDRALIHREIKEALEWNNGMGIFWQKVLELPISY